MLSLGPPGHDTETYNKQSPSVHSYYHSTSVQTDTATEYSISRNIPQISPQWY